ncbi:MAG: TIGR02449 family protein [Chromatiales bacterium 21-64-14]|nr:MAG: TIGR02449 family protein [Chromatiales bacterium 21-64-14]HQU16845.1 TIGR02449 family protein [Gammaproteobacteria bacterium]
MASENPNDVAEEEFRRLELRVDELVRLCERLKAENQALNARLDVLSQERAQLVQRNDLARSRVESMVTRLRTMEHG